MGREWIECNIMESLINDLKDIRLHAEIEIIELWFKIQISIPLRCECPYFDSSDC